MSLRPLGALALALAAACAGIDQTLVTAARRGDERLAAKLLASGAKPAEHDSHGNTALVWAAYRGDVGMLKLLLDHGGDANDRSAAAPYLSVLDVAILQGKDGAAELLLERGAAVDARDATGESPLNWAATKGDARIAAALIARGASIGARGSYSPHRDALLDAAAAGRREVIRLLLEKGADPNAWDDGAETALHLAAARDDAETARLLLEHGAHRLAKDGAGRTPADVARAGKHAGLAAILDPGSPR